MSSNSTDGPEQHTVTIKTPKREILLVNYYCPNNVNLELHNIHARYSNFIIMRDFNSHSQSWGNDHIDARGEEIEAWQDDNNLTIINQPYDTPTSYSRCWHSTSTSDIALCTEDNPKQHPPPRATRRTLTQLRTTNVPYYTHT